MIYLISATPRTRSTLLCHLLENSGVAGLPGEYFSHDGSRNFSEHLNSCIRDGVGGVSIMYKMMLFLKGEFDVTAFDKYIWMRRENKLEQAISFIKADKTEQFELLEGETPVDTSEIDPPSNLEIFNTTGRWVVSDLLWELFFQ